MELENISCPKCGLKMENGYMYPIRDIKWTYNNKPKFTALGDETLIGLSGFTMNKLLSYRCTGCKIVTFEYYSSN
ncbi:hypothetical protein KQI88_15400 [Alkaliphilus sp. MSJ-5]|uniref:DUF6487 domain-containing protein n=1 Tax=Alkaliphilus flagellatus TaxID=2841507 RepID=A0ABS6G859_9FIRM|nr:PF20097 family protein [Alkaliphilus flagellatus]MBU5677803.1 hypothetical protein [Alkaliphilus flagellatus]